MQILSRRTTIREDAIIIQQIIPTSRVKKTPHVKKVIEVAWH